MAAGAGCSSAGTTRELLDPQRTPDLAEKDPITFLRKYSNYLAPRNGLSLDALGDTCDLVSQYGVESDHHHLGADGFIIVLLAPGAAVRHMATDTMPDSAEAMLVACARLSLLLLSYQIGGNLRKIANREFDPVSVFWRSAGHKATYWLLDCYAALHPVLAPGFCPIGKPEGD